MSDRGALPVPPPPPRPQAARGFAWYLDRIARRTFATVRWYHAADAAPPDRPILVIANHTNWWDGFLSHQVSRAMGRHFRILMEAEHLARYPAFRMIGSLPMERRSRTQGMRDLAVATACLAPDALVWIYPQGRRTPAATPIQHLEQGAAWMLLRHEGPLRVLPVAFRYPFTSEQLPEACIRLGAPWDVEPGHGLDRAAVTARMAAMLTDTIASLDADLAVEDFTGYDTLVAGRESINLKLDRFRHRLGLLDHAPDRNG